MVVDKAGADERALQVDDARALVDALPNRTGAERCDRRTRDADGVRHTGRSPGPYARVHIGCVQRRRRSQQRSRRRQRSGSNTQEFSSSGVADHVGLKSFIQRTSDGSSSALYSSRSVCGDSS